MGLRNGKLQPIILPEHLEFLVKTSGLTEEQVKSKYEHFLREHPDNRISKKAFKEMINQVRLFFLDLSSFSHNLIHRPFLARHRQISPITYSDFMTRTVMVTSTLWSSWLFSTV